MTDRRELAQLWPQFALQISVEGAHLEPPTDRQLEMLAKRASRRDAVLPQSELHFVKWLEGRTPSEIEQQRIHRVQSNRDLSVHRGWTLDLAVIVDDEPVGLQSLSGLEQWPQRRIVGTTSWLLAPFQRRGLGTRIRAAVLELAFAHLSAESAKTWALIENGASNAVSTKLGYRQVDRDVITENGRELVERVYQIDKGDWLQSAARHRYTSAISGAEPLVTLLSG